MDNFDLRKYLAEGRLLKEEIKFIDYVTVDQDEFKAQYDKHYDDYGNDEDFVEEYGLDFLSPNMEKINKYYGAKVLEKDVRDDFFIGDGLEFISSNEKFEKWLDRNKEFYLGEGKLLKEDGLSKLLLKVLKAYQPEVEQQLGTKLANWKLDDMDDASATDVDELTGFSFKIASEFDDRFKGGGFGDDDTDPEIIDLANKKIAVIKYNL